MSDSTKVLVVGPPSTTIKGLFDKIAVLTSKHKFNITLIAGDLFEAASEDEISDVLNGYLKPPTDIYYTLGSKPLHEKLLEKVGSDGGGMIADGVFMLAKSSVLTTGNGLRIGAFGGIHDPSKLSEHSEHDNLHPNITATTLENFAEHFETPIAASSNSGSLAAARAKAKAPSNTSLDILLTHAWPSSITLLSNKDLPSIPGLPVAHSWGNSAVTSAVSYSTPKYVFSGGQGAFWEREPFISPNGLSTRFISLGHFGNSDKQRWFYAFSISPRGNTKEDAPVGCTPSPLPTLSNAKKRGAEDDKNSYIFAQQTSAYASEGSRTNKRGRKGNQPQEITQDECWFCLSNPRVTKHLIVSIGDECYITLPKGQLIDPKTSSIPGGGHVLIIPISHYPNLFSLPAEIAQRVQSELLDCRDALAKCYARYDSVPVSFELGRYWSRGGHAHIQVVPISNDLAAGLSEEFVNEGAAQGVEWEADPQKALDELEDGQSYLRIDLPNGRKLVHLIRPAPFNQQFARQVLANVLGMPDRADWRNCTLPDEQETEISNDFRNAFKPFDKNAYVRMEVLELSDEIEIVNAVYGEGSAVYKKEEGVVLLGTCVSIDGDVIVKCGEEAATVNVAQLPPFTVTLKIAENHLFILKVDAVASSTLIEKTLKRVTEAPTAEEKEESILMRIMSLLHSQPPAELVVVGDDTLAGVIKALQNHDREYKKAVFDQTSYDCQICLGRRKGAHCVKLECSCTFCKTCIGDMMRLHINEGSIDSLKCPSTECSTQISETAIGDVVGEELLHRYVYLRAKNVAEKGTLHLLQFLKTNNQVQDPRTVHCPLCQTPVTRPVENTGESDEGAQRLRVCPHCSFTFCCYCRKTYHGPVTACPVSTTHQFVRAYAAAPENSSERASLERKYGRKYLQCLLNEFIESESNRKLIERTSQACPNCSVRTEKISGCNHMSCRCGFHFCYLCGWKLNAQNPYPHFNTPGTHCFQKLFDGVIQTDGQGAYDDDIVIVDGQDDEEGFEIQLAIMQIAEEHM